MRESEKNRKIKMKNKKKDAKIRMHEQWRPTNKHLNDNINVKYPQYNHEFKWI